MTTPISITFRKSSQLTAAIFCIIIRFLLLCDKMDGLSHNDISMETLQTAIVNAIKAIRSSKKRADELTVYKFVKRELHLITNTDINNTLKNIN